MMLKEKKVFKACAIIFSLLIVNFPVFSQMYEDLDDEVENLLEEEEPEAESPVKKALQKNFIILGPERPLDLNPHTNTLSTSSQIFTGLYEGLFSYNPVNLEPQYAIAKDYKVSRDKKRVTFILREDAYFSNGDLITAYDVRDSWLQLLETEGAPFASMLDIVRGAREYREGFGLKSDVGIYANSDFVLSVYLDTPANYLPRVLCHASFAVVHRNPTVYSGPFTLYDQEQGCLILKKNPYYWDSANTYLEQITFVQSDDADENTFLYNTGAVDWVTSNIRTDKLLDNTSIQFNAQFGTSYYFFKNSSKKSYAAQQKFNPWDYEEFRSAVLEAFPWEAMRKDALVPATTLVYPLTGYPAVEGFDYTDNLEALNKMRYARQLYDVPEDEILPLILEISEYSLTDSKLQEMQDALLPLGIDLIVNKKSVYTYYTGVSKSDSDLFGYSWIGDFADPLAFLSLFQSNSTLNDSGWVNEDFDELIQKAATASDAERYNYLAQAETILLDSCMIIPIYHPVSFNVIDLKEVGGWSTNAFDLHPLKYLYKKPEVVVIENLVRK